MSTKLIAIGNVLMGDDGIAVYLAATLEERLQEIGIEVVYGETDIGFSISQIHEGDFVIILDAANIGKTVGEVALLSMEEVAVKRRAKTGHDISFLDMIKLYFPQNRYIIFTIQIEEIGLRYGLSLGLKAQMEAISQAIIDKINILHIA